MLVEGHLIGKIDTIELGDNPEFFINSYYVLLAADPLEKAQSHRQELIDLLPRYNVAFSAADSAELSELIDEINFHWAAIKSIHAQHFSSEVKNLLNQAYDNSVMRSSR